ncbi:MAG: hypothetical protein WHS64_09295 [Fervidobacterium sp.]|jgi:hypothetical protein|uniref:hypothetical protein n=1 Tax=Fervidobacterium sp. TaxID=1871331 RepID=UPI0030A69FD0
MKQFNCVALKLFLTLLLVTTTAFAYSQRWTFTKDVDPMTDKVNLWVAISPEVAPLESVAVPYKNIRAAVFVKYDGKKLSVGIVFNMYPPIPGGVTDDKADEGVYFETRIRWDSKEPERVKLFYPVLVKYVLFDDKITNDIINKLMTHSILTVEFDWLLWGVKHFKFPLDGSSEATKQVLNNVKK